MWTDAHFRERKRIARRLRDLRIDRGLTQGDLCERLGYAHPSSVSSIEKARRPLYLHDLERLAAALDCEIADLLGPPDARVTGYPLERSARMMGLVLMLLGGVLSADAALAEAATTDGGGPPVAAQGPDAGGDGSTQSARRFPILIESDNCDPTMSQPDRFVGS